MPTASNPTDDAPPPAASSSLSSLRQSLATAFDPRRSAAAASSDGAVEASTATSNTAEVDTALSRLGGANDGEFLFMNLGFSEGILSFPGGVGDESPSKHSSSSAEGSSVGVDPSLYSIDSGNYSLSSRRGSNVTSTLHRTPLRSNQSSSAGLDKKSVSIKGSSIFDSGAPEVSVAGEEEDDYSLLSGITTNTTATIRGVRSVGKALSKGLFSALETPLQSGGDNAVASASKLSFATPEGATESPARVGTPPVLDDKSLQALSISSPSMAVKQDRGVIASSENDPSACLAWMYDADGMDDLCLGTIGKKGLVCVNKAHECSIKSHKSHKTPLTTHTWYLLTKDEAILISPNLPNEVAERSGLWSMYKNEKYTPANWSSIFDWIRSNEAAMSPSQLITEADSTRLLQAGTVPKATVPKTPKLFKVTRGGDLTSLDDFKESLKVAERSFADLYSEITRLSSRIGLPTDPAKSHGSCHGDIEAVHLYTSSLDDSISELRKLFDSHHAALLKCDENFKKYDASINQVVASTLSASTAARNAQTVVQSFQSTGTVDRVNSQGQSIVGLQQEVSFLKNELAGVYDIVKELIDKVPALNSATAGSDKTADVEALKAELIALRKHTSNQIKVVKQSLDGLGPVSLGSWRFDSAEACLAQLTAWGVTTSVYERFFDLPHLLAALLYRCKTHKEVSDQAVLTMKTSLSAPQITAIASYETAVPEIFSGSASSGPGVETSKLTSLFAAIKTFDLFDSGDGETGVLNYIRLGLRDFLPQQQQEAESLFSVTNPEFLAFIGLMRVQAATALEELLKECVELYRNLLARACGYCSSYTKEQKAEAWQQVLILLQVYCHEVSKVRACARNLGNYKDPSMANALSMWACLSSLRIHDQFKKNLFREHPRIAPKLTGYILSTVLRKGELASVEDKAQRAATEAQRAFNTASSANQRATDLRSDLDRFINSFNTWKRQLDGAGDFPNKKKKLRDRRKKGDEDEAKDKEADDAA